MDTLSPVQDDNSGANPSSVKSEDSPRHESGRNSPPPKCAICLGTCRNKSFTDSCLHQFCFKCLLTWSKIKAECPLCKQNFRSIIHNVQSNHQYEEYMVEQRQTEEVTERIEIDNIASTTRRFRFRTTLTLPRRNTIAIQQLLMHYPLMADVFPPPAHRRRSPASFRRTVYRYNLWARPLPDFTGRYRDCTPEFYRSNDSQVHRLVPWLNRELHYLLNENIGHISYVIARILELLPQHHINSPEFRDTMMRYFGDRTEHFLHELFCFASTPYDMTGYDRNVQYTTDNRVSTMVNEVISSSESDASVDSDIVMISSSEPAETPPGPSRAPPTDRPPAPVYPPSYVGSRAPVYSQGYGGSGAPGYPQSYAGSRAPVYPQGYVASPADNVIPIETISQSDTDDDSSEVMVVGYIKPPQDRTPEVVDLLGSDSDVIVQETAAPEPAQSEPQEGASTGLVKITLKRAPRDVTDTDSDDSTYTPPPPRRRRASGSSAASARSRRSASASRRPGAAARRSPSASRRFGAPRKRTSRTGAASEGESAYRSCSSSASLSTCSIDSDTWDERCSTDSEPRSKTRKNRKSRYRIPLSERPRRHRYHRGDRTDRTPAKERNERKSRSKKRVKSTKKSGEADAPKERSGSVRVAQEQPSTSGTSRNNKRRLDNDLNGHRENKRLKSVVNVINSVKGEESSSSSKCTSNVCSSTIDKKSARTPSGSRPLVTADTDDTDSEDNLPLNLTITHPPSSM